MPPSDNPYAPPRVDPVAARDPEQLALEVDRQAHINAEYAVRGLSSLWLFGAALFTLGGLANIPGLIVALRASPDDGVLVQTASLVIGALLGGLMLAKLGLDTRRLRAWTWLPALCLCAAMLLGFPVGTLVGFYYILVLLSGRGRRVFRPDYPEVIARTPEIKRKTPLSVWIVLGVIAALIAFALVSA